MSSISFDRAADYYDATRGYPEATAAAIAAALCTAGGLGPGSQVLELGVGTGRIALPLLARGVNVVGVDISTRMLDRLQANRAVQRERGTDSTWGTLEVQVADMTALPFADATFDAVIGVHVLHLVQEWGRALDEALRVLRSKGSLLFGQDRHPESLGHTIQDHWQKIVRELGGQVVTLGAPSFERVLEALVARGLQVTTTTPVTWIKSSRPAHELSLIASRSGSRSWPIAEPIFSESVSQLEIWMRRHYGAGFDETVREVVLFSIARAVTGPAG